MLINTNYFTLTWPKTTLVYFHIRVSHSALSTLQFKSSGCYTIEGALNDRLVIFCSHSCLICRNSVSSRCNSYFKFFIRSRFLAARWHQTSRVWRRAATCSLDNKDAVRSIPLCHCQSELNRQNSRLSCWYFYCVGFFRSYQTKWPPSVLVSAAHEAEVFQFSSSVFKKRRKGNDTQKTSNGNKNIALDGQFQRVLRQSGL